MSVILEDGTGTNPLADAYIDPAGAAAQRVLDATFYKAAWTARSGTEQDILVRQATRVLDSMMDWTGQATLQDQPLGWPRYAVVKNYYTNGVPVPVATATLLLAMSLAESNRLADPGGGGSQPIKALNLGDSALELEFGEDPATGPRSIFTDEIATMLRDYGSVRSSKGSSVRRVYRG